MNRFFLVAAGALLLGAGSGEYLSRNFAFRRWVTHLVRRENLQALVGRHTIDDGDVERAWQAELFRLGALPEDLAEAAARAQKQAALGRLVTLAKLDEAAARTAIDSAALERELNLLRAQTRDAKAWQEVLQRGATNPPQLRGEVARNLRERQWIEDQIAARIRPNDEECRRYYEAHAADFAEPLRLRASHLFLAAPEGYSEEIIATKRALIENLAQRLANGEAFPALVAQFSEDEASKRRGGDLGYFAAERMLPEVFAAAQRLQPGATSPPIRSRLGFHLLRLTTVRPARELTLTEATPEIRTTIENERRRQAVGALVAALDKTR
jgi:parvulin-like peptidyl-prolyl isomerase